MKIKIEGATPVREAVEAVVLDRRTVRIAAFYYNDFVEADLDAAGARKLAEFLIAAANTIDPPAKSEG